MAQRVGQLFPVEQPYVNVFGDIHHGDGFSLHALTQYSYNTPESVSRTRCKIGLGKTLVCFCKIKMPKFIHK